VLARGVPFRFEARGYSMAPFIRNGDVVTISPLRGRRARFGDVVAFANSTDGLVVHRVVARGPGRYEIRADNPGGADDIVPATSVFGAVTRVERFGHSVRLGLGPERTLVGVLVRLGLLQRLVAILRAARTLFAGHRVL
jgi:phage repressor protein C with HTH and peptisase S24 domain